MIRFTVAALAAAFATTTALPAALATGIGSPVIMDSST